MTTSCIGSSSGSRASDRMAQSMKSFESPMMAETETLEEKPWQEGATDGES